MLGPLERKDNVFGGKSRSIVELHAFAQLERPAIRAGFPTGRQFRLKQQVGVAGDQGLVDLTVHRNRRAFVLRMRVQGQRIALAGPAQHIFCHCRTGDRQRQG